MTPGHLALLRDVNAAGGTLLSHSHTHRLTGVVPSSQPKPKGKTHDSGFVTILPKYLYQI